VLAKKEDAPLNYKIETSGLEGVDESMIKKPSPVVNEDE
jgi:hypothetical protein